MALGCLTIITLIAALGLAAGSCVIFLESGADSGTLVLEQAESYERGSLRYFGDRNFYLLRLPDGEFFALSNLDQPNRANPDRRCRVQPTATDDPAIASRYPGVAPFLSPASRGADQVFYESCNGALYDATGVVLAAEGFNLDRFPVRILDDGRVAVDLADPTCSRRTADALALPVDCP